MGLIIDGRHVRVDHACGDWLVTEPEGNPTEEHIGDLKIWSVFRRRLASAKLQRNREIRQLGDNCPIIYALKGKGRLTTDVSSLLALSESAGSILDAISAAEPAGLIWLSQCHHPSR